MSIQFALLLYAIITQMSPQKMRGYSVMSLRSFVELGDHERLLLVHIEGYIEPTGNLLLVYWING